MRNLTVKPFKNALGAIEFISENGGNTKQAADSLIANGYYQFKKWHIVIDPDGELTRYEKRSMLKEWRKCFKSWEMWLKVWRTKK